MMLAFSRKILSYLLSAIIAVVLVVAVISGINHLTIGNKNFYIKSFSTQALADECDKQLTEKYKTLSTKSNLPFDIFDSVKVKFDTKESFNQAAESLFDENDATLKNGSRYNYFKSTIGEYIEANDIKISDKTIDIVASEAQQIYSDTVGIHNLEFLQNDMQKQGTRSIHSFSICIVILAFAAFLFAYIYDKKVQFVLYFSSGIMAGGVATVLSSLVMRLTHVGTVTVSPAVWSSAFGNMANNILLFRIIAGIVVWLIGTALFVFAQHRINREQMRKNTRYSKIFAKL